MIRIAPKLEGRRRNEKVKIIPINPKSAKNVGNGKNITRWYLNPNISVITLTEPNVSIKRQRSSTSNTNQNKSTVTTVISEEVKLEAKVLLKIKEYTL